MKNEELAVWLHYRGLRAALGIKEKPRKAATRVHAWQLKQEEQKQKARIGTEASDTIAKGHCFGRGSIRGQGQELVKNQQQGQEEQAGRASGTHKGL